MKAVKAINSTFMPLGMLLMLTFLVVGHVQASPFYDFMQHYNTPALLPQYRQRNIEQQQQQQPQKLQQERFLAPIQTPLSAPFYLAQLPSSSFPSAPFDTLPTQTRDYSARYTANNPIYRRSQFDAIADADQAGGIEVQPEFVPLEQQGRHGAQETSQAGSKPFEVDVITTDVNGGNDGGSVSHLPGVFFKQSFPFLGNDFFNSFGGFGFSGFGAGAQEWWKGPNVCIEKSEEVEDEEAAKKPTEKPTDETDTEDQSNESSDVEEITRPLFGQFHFSLNSCVEKPNKYVCTRVINQNGKKKTLTVVRQCCNGYARPRNAGFTEPCDKLEIKSIDEAASELGAKDFVSNAKTADGTTDLLSSSKNVTIFLPLDAAFAHYNEHLQNENNIVAKSSGPDSVNLYKHHMVDGQISLYDITNEQVLKTQDPEQTIRINAFHVPPTLGPEPFRYTANCIPIEKHDMFIEQGMAHSLTGVLMPVKKTIMDLIRERPDMSIMRTVLETTKLSKLLEDDKPMTIFIPTDDAFDKLEPHLRRALKEGKGCATNILKNHMLDLTFCSVASIAGAKATAFNLLGESLQFNRSKSAENEDQSVKINNLATIKERDIMATNGVMHVIDTILPTESALPLSTLLKEKNVTLFQQLLEAAGLDETFNDLQNATVFAPTDKALAQTKWAEVLKNSPEQLKNNDELQELLNYHVVRPMTKTCDLVEKQLPTLAGPNVRINLYSTHALFSNVMNRATVNCARLVHFDDESCGSVLHQVDKVLTPPKMNLLQQLEANPNYSRFLELIRAANLTNLLNEQQSKQGYTLLVPKNDVFEEVGDWEQTLTKDPKELENLVKTHIVNDVVCCAGIIPTQWPFVRSVEALNGAHLRITRDRRPKIENAGITKCDNVALNGIIHEINDVIVTKRRQQRPQTQQQFDDLFF